MPGQKTFPAYYMLVKRVIGEMKETPTPTTRVSKKAKPSVEREPNILKGIKFPASWVELLTEHFQKQGILSFSEGIRRAISDYMVNQGLK